MFTLTTLILDFFSSSRIAHLDHLSSQHYLSATNELVLHSDLHFIGSSIANLALQPT